MVITMTIEIAMFVTSCLSLGKWAAAQQLHSSAVSLAGTVSRQVLESAVTQLSTQTLPRERDDLSLVMW